MRNKKPSKTATKWRKLPKRHHFHISISTGCKCFVDPALEAQYPFLLKILSPHTKKRSNITKNDEHVGNDKRSETWPLFLNFSQNSLIKIKGTLKVLAQDQEDRQKNPLYHVPMVKEALVLNRENVRKRIWISGQSVSLKLVVFDLWWRIATSIWKCVT